MDLPASGLVQVLLAVLGVIQTVALAIIADRSRRVRREDPAERHKPSDQA
jgi:hypothetical protein